MKRFLRAQEKGKFTNISKFVFPSYASKDFFNILFIYDQLIFCEERYNHFKYYINLKYYNNLNLYIDIDNNVNIESDSDSDSDSDNDYSDRGIYCERESIVDGKPYPGFIEFYDYFKRIFVQFKFGDSYTDSDSDSDSDSD